MTRAYFPDAHTVVVGPGVKTGLPVQMDNPREVGTDRVANAVGRRRPLGRPGRRRRPRHRDRVRGVNAAGQYVGGAIAPGVDISVDALGVARRPAAPGRDRAAPRSVIAKNTIEALQSGAVHGFAGLVDGLVARIVEELGVDDARVVATGASTTR